MASRAAGLARALRLARAGPLRSARAGPLRAVRAGPRRFLVGTARRFEVVPVAVPSLGDSITEVSEASPCLPPGGRGALTAPLQATIVSVDREVGDAVKADEVVAVLETDKVSVDVFSPHTGVVKEVLIAMDDTVQVGAP